MKHHREEEEKGESAILDNRTYATFFSPLRIFALPRLAMQFRGEKQALREERGDTTAFFFLLSRVVSPLTDGDHKSDRGEIAGKNYQTGETLRARGVTALPVEFVEGRKRREKNGNVISHDEVENIAKLGEPASKYSTASNGTWH